VEDLPFELPHLLLLFLGVSATHPQWADTRASPGLVGLHPFVSSLTGHVRMHLGITSSLPIAIRTTKLTGGRDAAPPRRPPPCGSRVQGLNVSSVLRRRGELISSLRAPRACALPFLPCDNPSILNLLEVNSLQQPIKRGRACEVPFLVYCVAGMHHCLVAVAHRRRHEKVALCGSLAFPPANTFHVRAQAHVAPSDSVPPLSTRFEGRSFRLSFSKGYDELMTNFQTIM
jgi:hypothetical protein